MKKFFYVLMAAATLAAVSCDKEGNNGNEGEEGKEKEVLCNIQKMLEEF